MLFYGLAITLIGVLTLLELRGGARLDRNRLLNVTNWAIRLGMAFALMRFLPVLSAPSLIDAKALPWPVAFLIFLLVVDFGEYLFHRAQHAVPWLWALHSLHHSDPDMNATTTERHHWADQFLKAVTIFPAAAFVISPTVPVGFAYMLCTLWNYVCHSDTRLTFGRWSWVLNSPAYHRRHHSNRPEHYNSNFAALLPLWDVLAGSYRKPDSFPRTGLDTEPESLADLMTWPLRAAGRLTPAR